MRTVGDGCLRVQVIHIYQKPLTKTGATSWKRKHEFAQMDVRGRILGILDRNPTSGKVYVRIAFNGKFRRSYNEIRIEYCAITYDLRVGVQLDMAIPWEKGTQ